jgi:hypothetical protein
LSRAGQLAISGRLRAGSSLEVVIASRRPPLALIEQARSDQTDGRVLAGKMPTKIGAALDFRC